MQLKGQDPRDLVVGLLERSICKVQVAAVLADNWGIHAWGHNHMGFRGNGMCAEAFCLSRANRSRLPKSTLYIASRRLRNGKVVSARPCEDCQKLLKSIGSVVYRDSDGIWKEF